MLQRITRKDRIFHPGFTFSGKAIYIICLIALIVCVSWTIGLLSSIAGATEASAHSTEVMSFTFISLILYFYYSFAIRVVGGQGQCDEKVLWDPAKEEIVLRSKNVLWITFFDPILKGRKIRQYGDIFLAVNEWCSMIISQDSTTIYEVFHRGGEILWIRLPERYAVVSFQSVEAYRFFNGSAVFEGEHQSYQLKVRILTVQLPEVARRMRMGLGSNISDGLNRWLDGELRKIAESLTAFPTEEELFTRVIVATRKRWNGDIIVDRSDCRVVGPF